MYDISRLSPLLHGWRWYKIKEVSYFPHTDSLNRARASTWTRYAAEGLETYSEVNERGLCEYLWTGQDSSRHSDTERQGFVMFIITINLIVGVYDMKADSFESSLFSLFVDTIYFH